MPLLTDALAATASAITALGALGTAAFGLVDATKAFEAACPISGSAPSSWRWRRSASPLTQARPAGVRRCGPTGSTASPRSLGARVVPAAAAASKQACITASAVNAGCLTEEFAAASANCDNIVTLSCRSDKVLEFAYPPRDLLADALDPDHPPGQSTLGREEPHVPLSSWVRAYEIADANGYDHSDYLPPAVLAGDAPADARWRRLAQFMAEVLRGRSPAWTG